jgi:hypothetical protein
MIGAQDLSRIINMNGGNLLDAIKIEDIQSFNRLVQWLHEGNISENTEFQDTFRDFYGIGGVGVNKEFIKRYFEILEEHKADEEFNFRQVSKELLGARPKRKLSSAQFSYLSKMANIVDASRYPVYDNHVADLFEFDKPVQAKLDSRERMNVYLEFYQQLSNTYQEVLAEGNIRQNLVVFKILLKKYQNDEFPKYQVPDMKKLDFIVEMLGKLQGSLVKA